MAQRDLPTGTPRARTPTLSVTEGADGMSTVASTPATPVSMFGFWMRWGILTEVCAEGIYADADGCGGDRCVDVGD